MAITGSVRRALVGSSSATQGGPRVRRTLRLVTVAALAVGVAVFATLTVVYLLDPGSVHSVDGFAGAWWGSMLAVLGLSVAACVCDTDGCEDGHYLGSLVEGLRSEWRRRD